MNSKGHKGESAGIVPDAGSNVSKKLQVADMFNKIAARYDFLNHFLSLGIDKRWRKKAISKLTKINPERILDVATGTGDLAIAAVKTGAKHIMGIDIAEQMLELGRKKVAEQNLEHIIRLQMADSEDLPFADGEYDAVMCAFGVRNFENLETGLKEMCRVLHKDGKLVVLEFSRPVTFPFRQFYGLYFGFILPVMGRMVSKHKSAYSYLPKSVKAFPQGREFCEILLNCGFKRAKAERMTMGVATLYTAIK